MNRCEARQILISLVEGRWPGSEEPLSSDSVVHQADVLRAMLVGIEALESIIARGKRRALLPGNVGQSWTGSEVEQLRSACLAKVPITVIAARHGRTVRAVEVRLQRMGLISAADRKTRGGFAPAE